MSIFTIHYSHPNDLPFSINKVRHMAVATAMSRSHSWGMIKSRFAFYSSWFLLHLEQAEFMPRYQQTWQQHSWGRGPMPRRRAQLYGSRAQQGDRQVFTILMFYLKELKERLHDTSVSLCGNIPCDRPDNPKSMVVPRMFKVKKRDQRT